MFTITKNPFTFAPCLCIQCSSQSRRISSRCTCQLCDTLLRGPCISYTCQFRGILCTHPFSFTFPDAVVIPSIEATKQRCTFLPPRCSETPTFELSDSSLQTNSGQ